METQYISLNMTPSGVNPIFHISQYDVGRLLGFYVYNGSEVVDLDDYTCTVEATRTDGTQITTNVITNNNSGIFAVTATMSNVADKYNCQLVIVDGNANRVASLPFIMNVVTAALNGNDSSIYDDRSLYQQYNASMQSALANEANVRANKDTLLQAQINQIVAPTGEAPRAAEVENARIGADGTVYPILGNAIRGQITKLSNYKVNQPLDENNLPTYGMSGQSLRTNGNGITEWADVGLPTDEQTEQAVSDWLDEHPEATTTVQDWSLTYKKIVKGSFGFVTPQMFGAVGDGVSDDTQALKDAILFCKGNKYVLYVPIGIYNISDNIVIDFPLSIIGNNGATIHESEVNLSYGSVLKCTIPDSDASGNFITFTGTNNGTAIIRDLLIKGNNKNINGLYLQSCGWTMYMNRVCIDGFKQIGLGLFKQYDSNFVDVTIERCGLNNAALWISSSGDGNTNAIHFVNLHMEFCRKYVYTKYAQDITFTNCKFEIRRNSNANDGYYGFDGSSLEYFTFNGEQSDNINFIGCTFCLRGLYRWSIVTNDSPITNAPYFFKMTAEDDGSSDVCYSTFVNFDSCRFFSPDNDGGFKLFSSDVEDGLVNIENCILYNVTPRTKWIQGKNYKITNNYIFFGVHKSINSYAGDTPHISKSFVRDNVFKILDATVAKMTNSTLFEPIYEDELNIVQNTYVGLKHPSSAINTYSKSVAIPSGVSTDSVITTIDNAGTYMLNVDVVIPTGGADGRIQYIVIIGNREVAWRNTLFSANTYKDSISVPCEINASTDIKVRVLQSSGQEKNCTITAKIMRS